METFSALLVLSAGNSPVPGELPAQRLVTRSFAVLLDLRLNKRLSKQSCGRRYETSSYPLWRHCNGQYRGWWCPVPQRWHWLRNLREIFHVERLQLIYPISMLRNDRQYIYVYNFLIGKFIMYRSDFELVILPGRHLKINKSYLWKWLPNIPWPYLNTRPLINYAMS